MIEKYIRATIVATLEDEIDKAVSLFEKRLKADMQTYVEDIMRTIQVVHTSQVEWGVVDYRITVTHRAAKEERK